METELIADYLESLRVRGLAVATITLARHLLDNYTRYLRTRRVTSFFAATEQHTRGYYRAVVRAGLSWPSVCRKVNTVYRFYDYLCSQGYLLLNPGEKVLGKRVPSLLRFVPDQEMMRQVYERFGSLDTDRDWRNFVLVDLAYSCGLRRGELHRLNIQDIDESSGTLHVTGKGGHERVVPVGPHTMENLRYYLYHVRPRYVIRRSKKTTPLTTTSRHNHHNHTTTRAVFVSRKGGRRLHVDSITNLFPYLRRRGILPAHLTAHTLRHAFATELVRNGAPVQDVSAMLGHAQFSTTQRYTHLNPRHLKTCLETFHPRG